MTYPTREQRHVNRAFSAMALHADYLRNRAEWAIHNDQPEVLAALNDALANLKSEYERAEAQNADDQ